MFLVISCQEDVPAQNDYPIITETKIGETEDYIITETLKLDSFYNNDDFYFDIPSVATHHKITRDGKVENLFDNDPDTFYEIEISDTDTSYGLYNSCALTVSIKFKNENKKTIFKSGKIRFSDNNSEDDVKVTQYFKPNEKNEISENLLLTYDENAYGEEKGGYLFSSKKNKKTEENEKDEPLYCEKITVSFQGTFHWYIRLKELSFDELIYVEENSTNM